jgi:hypothetical protein
MYLTIAGLLIASLTGVLGALTDTNSPWKKWTLTLFAVAALMIGVLSANHEQTEKTKSGQKADQLQGTVDDLRTQLQAQQELLKLVNLTVGDLGTLNQLSGGRKYYVRIATDSEAGNLEPYMNRIENQFPGAKDNHLVKIRPAAGSAHNYELVFGAALDPAAAEVFKRLADASRFPPAPKGVQQPAEIHLEPQ